MQAAVVWIVTSRIGLVNCILLKTFASWFTLVNCQTSPEVYPWRDRDYTKYRKDVRMKFVLRVRKKWSAHYKDTLQSPDDIITIVFVYVPTCDFPSVLLRLCPDEIICCYVRIAQNHARHEFYHPDVTSVQLQKNLKPFAWLWNQY